MNDSALRQDILDELEFEPSIDANDIGVAVEDGIVTLTGHVSSYSQREAVARAVSHVKGVRAIAQEIEVRLPSITGDADDEIARRVIDTLKWSTLVPDNRVQVMVQDGWVTLTGTLEWHYQKTGAGEAIRHIDGVRGVTNLITLAPKPAFGDVRKRIEDALRRRAEVEADQIQVDVSGNKVTLTGTVRTLSERSAVEEAAWATPGVHSVEDRLIVS
ncbi:BON domain-containing protein [Devosia sp. CN2-171]|jgi:osmotically-inducible protein OsmY|uniref:BON domain-containing protein n=1 Tax=Devosia sp. CN2-171 TaxID=3400909 RepID=UPI003BF867E9